MFICNSTQDSVADVGEKHKGSEICSSRNTSAVKGPFTFALYVPHKIKGIVKFHFVLRGACPVMSGVIFSSILLLP